MNEDIWQIRSVDWDVNFDEVKIDYDIFLDHELLEGLKAEWNCTYTESRDMAQYLSEQELKDLMESWEYLTSETGTCFTGKAIKIVRIELAPNERYVQGLNYDVYNPQSGELISRGNSCSCYGAFNSMKPFPGCKSLKTKKLTIMQKLNVFFKKVVDQDLKTLIKAGWVDECLNLTADGKEALMALLFFENKVELAKAAQEKLDEEKEEKEEKKTN